MWEKTYAGDDGAHGCGLGFVYVCVLCVVFVEKVDRSVKSELFVVCVCVGVYV